jgi:hypothetical protein
MAEDPWTVLEIAPGARADAIRRAYVAQLKAIDVDADPAAFMRLREAFDAALAGTTPMEPEREQRTEREIAPPTETVVPKHAIAAPYGALNEATVTFDALIKAGATREAAAFLERLLAQGIVPLGGEDAFVRALTACALADDGLSADDLSRIATTFHAAQAGERAAALRWRAGIETDLARGKGIRGTWARYGRAPTRIARALLAGMAKHDLWSGDLPALRREVTLAARYARWFPDFVDAVNAEKQLVRLERSLRAQELLAIIAFAIIVALLVFAHAWEWPK